MADVVITRDASTAAAMAADVVQAQLDTNPETVLGLATGGTMRPIYLELVERYRSGHITFSSASAYLLDEYVGELPSSDWSYRREVQEVFANHVDLAQSSLHSPDGNARDPGREADRYEMLVRSAQVELQLLGLGRNGHLAFNEPGSAFDSSTRVVELSEQTRSDNARFFRHPAQVPAYAITQGIATIMSAKRLVLIATGSEKAAALEAAVEGPATTDAPASVIRNHMSCQVIADEAAASLLNLSRLGAR